MTLQVMRATSGYLITSAVLGSKLLTIQKYDTTLQLQDIFTIQLTTLLYLHNRILHGL